MSLLVDADQKGSQLLKDSLVKKYRVRRVPPNPHPSAWLSRRHPWVAAKLVDNRLKTDFLSHKLSEHNCGSNKGLARVWREIFEDEGMHDGSSTKYKAVTMDVNLFHRTLKVIAWFND